MTQYATALGEYESEDDNGRHRIVYAYFGLAVYFSQCLEETFSRILWIDRIFKNKIKTNKEVNDIIDAIEGSKRTMGNFISEVRQSYKLSEELEGKLIILLDKRNYLVHKYFKLEITRFYSELGQKEMIKYFCDFIHDSEEIDHELKSYYTIYTEKLGITDDKIEKLMADMKANG